MTWWNDYQARRGLDRKTLYVNNMKNTISTEFKNSTSYNLVKINNVDRDVRIVEESSIIKNPNKKRLLCYPDETISVGNIILWNSENWICTETDNTSEVSDVGLISRCNNVLKFYDKTQNNILYNIPCIIVDKITTDLQENKFLLTIDCDILVIIANNDINNLISPNEIFKIGRYSYYITKPDDVTKPGLIILPMKFTEEMQEEHLYTLEILNGNSVDVQISTELQLNINVYDNGTLISPLPSLIFTSSNELIADVSENGLVNIYDIVDNCNITVSLESDNSVFDIININVIENVQNNITYSLTSESLPDNEIILTQTKVYEVNKYNNGNLVEQTFTFSIIGDLSAYQLVVLDGNSCSVKALKSGSVIILKAIDDSNGEIVLKDIRLKNLF